MARRSIVPLFIGTFLLRANYSLNTVVLGLLLAQIETVSRYMHVLSLGSLQVGLLPVVFYVTELLLAPYMGSLSDRWGRRNFLIIGPSFGLIQASFLFFTPTINPLLYLSLPASEDPCALAMGMNDASFSGAWAPEYLLPITIYNFR